MTKGKLYLIPCTLGESPADKNFPSYNSKLIGQLSYFIVENERTARRFLKKLLPSINIDSLTFFVLNKRTDSQDLSIYLQPTEAGHSIGLLSEAGCPAVADPGSEIVKIPHQKEIDVIPLIGPSSILLAQMSSGFNGQKFAFHGYLPIDNVDRIKEIKLLESESKAKNQSQIFIETPFRNNKLLESLKQSLSPNTQLCIACDLTLDTEFIKTKSILEWKKQNIDLNKRPCIFIIYVP